MHTTYIYTLYLLLLIKTSHGLLDRTIKMLWKRRQMRIRAALKKYNFPPFEKKASSPRWCYYRCYYWRTSKTTSFQWRLLAEMSHHYSPAHPRGQRRWVRSHSQGSVDYRLYVARMSGRYALTAGRSVMIVRQHQSRRRLRSTSSRTCTRAHLRRCYVDRTYTLIYVLTVICTLHVHTYADSVSLATSSDL